jgi:uncharacterized protein (DUF427 family)
MADHVRVSPVARIRVVLGGETIVDTDRGYVVHEGGLPSRYYVPREDVRAELTATADVGSCPWKGQWRHLDVTLGGEGGAGSQRLPKGAWVYDSTLEVAKPIEGFVSFYPHKVDSIEAQE